MILGFGLGGSYRSQKQRSEAEQFLDPVQQRFLEQLYGRAADLTRGEGPTRQFAGFSGIQDLINRSQPQQFSQFQQLGQAGTAGAGNALQAAIQAAQTGAGEDPRLGIGQPAGLGGITGQATALASNPFVTETLSVRNSPAFDQFQKELAGLKSKQAASGGIGGSRALIDRTSIAQQHGERLAAQDAQIRLGLFNTGLGLANQRDLLGQQLQGNALSDYYNFRGQSQRNLLDASRQGQSLINQGNQQLGQALGGQQLLRGLNQGRLDTNYANQLNPYNQIQFFRNVIGDPRVLSRSQATGSSRGLALSGNFGSGQPAPALQPAQLNVQPTQLMQQVQRNPYLNYNPYANFFGGF